MEIIRTGPRWAIIRASGEAVRKALADPHVASERLLSGDEHLLKTGAKLYARDVCEWLVSGYSSEDVPQALALMREEQDEGRVRPDTPTPDTRAALLGALQQIRNIERSLYNLPDDVRERAAIYAGALGEIRLINAAFERILKGE